VAIQKVLRRATAPAAGLLLALAGFAPTMAGAAPRWRVDAVVTPRSGSLALSSVVATGKTDAWSAGTAYTTAAGKTEVRLIVEHFNGRGWHQFPVPARLAAVRLDAEVFIGASSAANVWVFELAPGHPQRILRWNGQRWIAGTAPAWVFRGSQGDDSAGQNLGAVAVFGRAGTWIFSLSALTQRSEAARYLYGRWRLVKLPGIPTSVDAVSADDIWASGPADNFSGPLIMSWNGRSWSKHTAPGRDWNGKVASDSPDSAWLMTVTTLDYWDGSAWTTTALPPGLLLERITTDGHGGAWLWGPEQAGAGLFLPYNFAHYSDGRWSEEDAPTARGGLAVDVSQMCQVPASTSVIAVGAVFVTSSRVNGAILRYAG
jgi:hypothetical protein